MVEVTREQYIFVRASIPVDAASPAGAVAVDDIWYNVTTRRLERCTAISPITFVPIVQTAPSKGFVIENPVAADDMPFWRTDVAITLTEAHYLSIGGTNWVGQLQEYDGNGANPTDTQTSDTTATAGIDAEVTSFSNAAIAAGNYIGIKTTSISGTPTLLVVTFSFTED